MALTTPRMGLRVWNDLDDKYDHEQLADNFAKIDFHNHTPGRGNRIPTDGIEDNAIISSKIANGVVGTTEIADGSVTSVKLADDAVTSAKMADSVILGLSEAGIVRRGKSVIPTEQSRSGASPAYLTTQDRVQNVVLPADALLYIYFVLDIKESVANNAEIFLYVGGTQVSGSLWGLNSTAGTSVGSYGSAWSTEGGSFGIGNFAVSPQSSYANGLPTSPIVLPAPAGTYEVGLQFAAASGTVTARNRKLFVWTKGF